MTKIDLSLFDISTIETKFKKSYRNHQRPEVSHECARPNCLEPAYYKAPKSPKQLNQYRYFCLKHIREHNERWNFCENMTEAEIIRHLEKDIVGHRPTWKNGMSASKKHSTHKNKHDDIQFQFDDPFDLAKTMFDTMNPKANNKKTYQHKRPDYFDATLNKIHDACGIIEIDFPPSFDLLRQNYKRLVKQYHPDINKKDVDAEQKLRKIVEAYRLICDFLEK